MDKNHQIDLKRFEDDLWEAADNLRANSKLTSSDYFMPVLGVIFLRHAANRFDVATKQIQDDQASGKMPRRKVLPDDYIRRRALWLPETARYDYIMAQATSDVSGLPSLITGAMNAIEESFEPLQAVLPKDYGIFEPKVLEELMRLFNSEEIKRATGDVFGRIYEYFLAKFSIQKAHDNGEFFTPSSLVQTIVNVIEPDHGIVFDPACGSGGMFVQSSHFIEHEGGDAAKKVTFYGQEKNRDTIRIAKMNLAVHGLEGKIAEAITYYQDEHTLPGKCDFVMANPPFNVDLVDAERIKADPRLPFGLPGVNKDKRVSNGNYLWISYFWSYLNNKGRAGFVMSSQASSAGHGEKEVRKKIAETGDVDVMISVRSGFFYTRGVPCELWHFDRNKPKERRDQILMIDARYLGQLMKGSRKVYEFTPEQLKNVTAIVWLYRGQRDRFLDLLRSYQEQCAAALDVFSHSICAFFTAEETEPLTQTIQRLAAFAKTRADYDDDTDEETESNCKALKDQTRTLETQLQEMQTVAAKLHKPVNAMRKELAKSGYVQSKSSDSEMESLAGQIREFTHELDTFWKAIENALDFADIKLGARRDKQWKAWNVRGDLAHHEKTRELVHADAKKFDYFRRQIVWLLHRFPDAKFTDVLGLCKIVTRADIAKADWSLTPGRYVGVAPLEADDNFDFEQTMQDTQTELEALNKEAVSFAKTIQKNFEELGI